MNDTNNFIFFRVSSDLFPWSSEYNLEELPDYNDIKNTLKEIGLYVKKNNMRLTSHPGPFNVLTSPNENVVLNCIKDLTIQGETGSQINGYNAYIVTAVGHFEDRQGIEQNVGFTTFLVTVDEMLYTIQYSNDLESYENQVPLVDEVINSIEFSDISFAKVLVESTVLRR